MAYETRRAGSLALYASQTRYSLLGMRGRVRCTRRSGAVNSRARRTCARTLGAMRACCAPSSCCASCRTRGIICGQGTTTIGTFTPHAMPGVYLIRWDLRGRRRSGHRSLARALRCLTSNTILLDAPTTRDGSVRQERTTAIVVAIACAVPAATGHPADGSREDPVKLIRLSRCPMCVPMVLSVCQFSPGRSLTVYSTYREKM